MMIHSSYYIAAALVLMLGCASAGKTARSGDENGARGKVEVNNPTLSLAEYLRKVPGVNVIGSGNNVKVTIRGSTSFELSTDPLYVVDGRPVGRSYARVTGLVNIHDIDYIKVLKGADAAFYGVRGGNGVIVIATKKE